MRNKPELLATASSLEEMKVLLAAGADAFAIGESRYGLRLPGEFGLPAMAEAVRLAHAHGAKIYAVVNNIMDNRRAEELSAYIRGVAETGADAVVFGDPAVLMAVRSEAPHLKLHWNAEMTSTNYASANYWGRFGATRVVLARELNLEQVKELKARTSLEVQVQVHGMTNIYHSRRELVGSYLDHRGAHRAVPVSADAGLYLTEEERAGEMYPIYEDANGTHMMSADDICMIEDLHELLAAGIDSLRIEGLMKSVAYNETVVRSYRAAIDAYAANPDEYVFREEWLDAIRAVQPPGRELSFGFFYKEQVY